MTASVVPSDISPDVLTDGHWETVRGVQRWVADDPMAPAVITGLIACPSCHARIDETCKTATGRVTTPHTVRLVPRLCPCGAGLPAPKRRMCDECSARSLQRSKNEHSRRRRARAA